LRADTWSTRSTRVAVFRRIRSAREVRATLARWDVGPETTVVTQGARGADTIIAEEALARGAKVVLCLALPPDKFERESVELPGSDWTERFRALLEVAEVLLPDERHDPDEDVFARANARVVEVARSLSDAPYAIVVWNGEGGDGPGGTLDLIERLGKHLSDSSIAVVDPTPPADLTLSPAIGFAVPDESAVDTLGGGDGTARCGDGQVDLGDVRLEAVGFRAMSRMQPSRRRAQDGGRIADGCAP
jgi:hypothetical protein